MIFVFGLTLGSGKIIKVFKTVLETNTSGRVEYIKTEWVNNTEGTRQIDFVTSGEKVLFIDNIMKRGRK